MILREGFTTGTAAAAAAKVGVMLLAGQACPDAVEVPLPMGGRLVVPVDGAEAEGDAVRVGVVKDGGDDPDATHGLRIEAVVRLGGEGVGIDGGLGVGRVTLPGLPVTVGQAAINPAPRRQIAQAVAEALAAVGLDCGVQVRIEVPDGEAAARRTFNARLGILGGISILGTRGTVKPFSHEAYRATILAGLDVALASGLRTVHLSTGGRSERLLRREYPDAPDPAFIQIADFFGFTLGEAAGRGLDVVIGVFFGKLMKMASGVEYTHAASADRDFAALARLAADCGLCPSVQSCLAGCNTARQALELLRAEGSTEAALVLDRLCTLAVAQARRFSGDRIRIGCLLFGFDGAVLVAQRQ